MNTLIINKVSPYYRELTEHHTIYEYEFNPDHYVCIDIDDEYLCMLKLRLQIAKSGRRVNRNSNVYVVLRKQH